MPQALTTNLGSPADSTQQHFHCILQAWCETSASGSPTATSADDSELEDWLGSTQQGPSASMTQSFGAFNPQLSAIRHLQLAPVHEESSTSDEESDSTTTSESSTAGRPHGQQQKVAAPVAPAADDSSSSGGGKGFWRSEAPTSTMTGDEGAFVLVAFSFALLSAVVSETRMPRQDTSMLLLLAAWSTSGTCIAGQRHIHCNRQCELR